MHDWIRQRKLTQLEQILDVAIQFASGACTPLTKPASCINLENRLAIICHNKALVHEYADDVTGAVALYEQAIAIRERLVNQEGRREIANYLANSYMGKANAVRALEDNQGAVALYE